MPAAAGLGSRRPQASTSLRTSSTGGRKAVPPGRREVTVSAGRGQEGHSALILPTGRAPPDSTGLGGRSRWHHTPHLGGCLARTTIQPARCDPRTWHGAPPAGQGPQRGLHHLGTRPSPHSHCLPEAGASGEPQRSTESYQVILLRDQRNTRWRTPAPAPQLYAFLPQPRGPTGCTPPGSSLRLCTQPSCQHSTTNPHFTELPAAPGHLKAKAEMGRQLPPGYLRGIPPILLPAAGCFPSEIMYAEA